MSSDMKRRKPLSCRVGGVAQVGVTCRLLNQSGTPCPTCSAVLCAVITVMSAASDPAKEHQLILRLPADHADKVRGAMKHGTLDERLQVEFIRDEIGEMRRARVKLDEETLPGKLIDLPTIIESYKTLDNKNLYKTGDISQMLVCSDDPDTYSPPAKGASIDDMTASRKKELYKTFISNHGITPPMKNVRKRRFRKTKTKKMIDSPEVEKEVKRLLRADTFAVNVTFKVVNDDKQDDSQSVMSDSVSRSQTPRLMVDEDSLLSLPSDYTPDDKSELVRILEEVSCSSSSEGSEDEEISVVDEPGGDSEEASELRAAAQDLETQIEEQKLKIQNTPNKILRARFETFLEELEKQHQSILDQLSRLN